MENGSEGAGDAAPRDSRAGAGLSPVGMDAADALDLGDQPVLPAALRPADLQRASYPLSRRPVGLRLRQRGARDRRREHRRGAGGLRPRPRRALRHHRRARRFGQRRAAGRHAASPPGPPFRPARIWRPAASSTSSSPGCCPPRFSSGSSPASSTAIIRRDLIPAPRRSPPPAARRRRPSPAASSTTRRDYNTLQKLAYAGVLFVLFPLMIATGLADVALDERGRRPCWPIRSAAGRRPAPSISSSCCCWSASSSSTC